MLANRTSVGLDVHARSVVACGLDGQTGELFERRLLHLGEIVAVTVPSVEQEAARDLVRAREDVRADLTSARHRLSKLLLRQGIVYSGGAAWTGPHDRWLRAQRHERVFDTPGWAPRSTSPTTRCWPPRRGGTGWTRRSPRWPPTAPTPRWRPGWAACV